MKIVFDVTILILLETTLQYYYDESEIELIYSHNPYFTGNHFAIIGVETPIIETPEVTILILLETTLQ